MAYRSINPYNEKVLKTYDDIGDDALEAAVARAELTFETLWSRESLTRRAAILKRAASLMRERSADLARLISLEMGKLINESVGEVTLSADILDYYADQGPRMLAAKELVLEEGEAAIESEPLGVLFCVEPWNFPYYQLARVAGPSLVLGNVMLVKHASNVPQCAEAFERVFLDAGAPTGVYTNLFASKEQISKLIADPRIKAVALTGSEAAGAIVAAQAGKALKKSTMELGGSDAFVVLEDADLDRAVSWAVWGRMNNTGQCCIAAKRFIVVDKVADEFLERFKASLELLAAGDPMEPQTTLGPL